MPSYGNWPSETQLTVTLVRLRASLTQPKQIIPQVGELLSTKHGGIDAAGITIARAVAHVTVVHMITDVSFAGGWSQGANTCRRKSGGDKSSQGTGNNNCQK